MEKSSPPSIIRITPFNPDQSIALVKANSSRVNCISNKIEGGDEIFKCDKSSQKEM
jgi:hypothetical protein